MSKRLRILAILPLYAALAACDAVVLNPSGDIAAQQRDLLVTSTVLMLLIIVPVMALTVFFAWRYRHTNRKARYEPDWHHSMRLELVIWSAPLLIIICLGALTWLGTHLLDPYRPLDRIAPGQPVPEDAAALEVNVVALDWKWLFIYPAVRCRHRQRARGTGQSADLPAHHRVLGDELALHPGARRADLRHARHGNAAPRRVEQGRHLRGLFRELQRRGLLGHAPDIARPCASRLRPMGRHGQVRKRNLDARYATSRWRNPRRTSRFATTASVDAQLYAAILGMCVQPGKTCMHDMMASHAGHHAPPD